MALLSSIAESDPPISHISICVRLSHLCALLKPLDGMKIMKCHFAGTRVVPSNIVLGSEDLGVGTSSQQCRLSPNCFDPCSCMQLSRVLLSDGKRILFAITIGLSTISNVLQVPEWRSLCMKKCKEVNRSGCWKMMSLVSTWLMRETISAPEPPMVSFPVYWCVGEYCFCGLFTRATLCYRGSLRQRRVCPSVTRRYCA